MQSIFDRPFDIIDLSPDTETNDGEINLTIHMTLRAVMPVKDIAILFGVMQETEEDQAQADFVPPLELIPGFWDGSGSPRNAKTVVDFKGLEFKELRVSGFHKVGEVKANNEPVVQFENCRANGFKFTPAHSHHVTLTFKVHCNDDIEGDHIGRVSDELARSMIFTIEQKDLFDKVAEAGISQDDE